MYAMSRKGAQLEMNPFQDVARRVGDGWCQAPDFFKACIGLEEIENLEEFMNGMNVVKKLFLIAGINIFFSATNSRSVCALLTRIQA